MPRETQGRTLVSDGQAGIRQEIQEMILDSAQRALELVGKSASSKEGRNLSAKFESMTRVYSGRRPVPDLLREMQAATEELIAKQAGATVQDEEDPVMSTLWTQATKKGAEEAKEKHLRKAKAYFEEENEAAGAEELCKAINCQIATIAAQHGWPHQTLEDIDNAVTALGTGTLPQKGDNLSELLEAASELGDELNSAFIAARSQPSLATDTVFHGTDEKFSEDATFFAERTIELASLLAGDGR
jgi:hypothetical protein